jgi:hypothetical protein
MRSAISCDDILRRYQPSPNNVVTPGNIIENNTLTGATGKLTCVLYRLFNDSQRKFLRQLALTGNGEERGELCGELLELQKSLENTTLDLFQEFKSAELLLGEAVSEALGAIKYIAPEDEDSDTSFHKRKFFSCVANYRTEKEYARRVAQMLRLFILLLDERNRVASNIELSNTHKILIHRFKESSRSKEDIQQLILELLKIDGGIHSTYNREVLCILPIANFISAGNLFVSSDTASKTMSAIKYLCRGCLMLHLLSMPQGSRIEDADVLRYIKYNIGGTSSWQNLVRMHKALTRFPRRVHQRVRHTEGDSVFVDGIDLGPRVILEAVIRCFEETRVVFKKLLMKYEPEPMEKGVDDDMSPFVAFGQQATCADGKHCLLMYVTANKEICKKFFTAQGQVKTERAQRYLKNCILFEKSALVLMHLLMGAGSRATDFEQLTFRNSHDLIRHIWLYDEETLLVDRQSRKTSLLHDKDDRCLVLLPRKWFEHVIQYWITVRPFASILARALQRSNKEVDRWQRFCFIKASSKVVSKCVCAALGGQGKTFQRLRHAIEAIFREKVIPQEHMLLEQFPFDKLLGHSRTTGLSYGVRILEGSNRLHAATDITGIRRCLKTYWRILGLDEIQEKDLSSIVDDTATMYDSDCSIESESSMCFEASSNTCDISCSMQPIRTPQNSCSVTQAGCSRVISQHDRYDKAI